MDVEYGEINLKLIPDRDNALDAFSAGICDVLDQSYHLERDAETVASLQADPEATFLVEQDFKLAAVGFWDQARFL